MSEQSTRLCATHGAWDQQCTEGKGHGLGVLWECTPPCVTLAPASRRSPRVPSGESRSRPRRPAPWPPPRASPVEQTACRPAFIMAIGSTTLPTLCYWLFLVSVTHLHDHRQCDRHRGDHEAQRPLEDFGERVAADSHLEESGRRKHEGNIGGAFASASTWARGHVGSSCCVGLYLEEDISK